MYCLAQSETYCFGPIQRTACETYSFEAYCFGPLQRTACETYSFQNLQLCNRQLCNRQPLKPTAFKTDNKHNLRLTTYCNLKRTALQQHRCNMQLLQLESTALATQLRLQPCSCKSPTADGTCLQRRGPYRNASLRGGYWHLHRTSPPGHFRSKLVLLLAPHNELIKT